MFSFKRKVRPMAMNVVACLGLLPACTGSDPKDPADGSGLLSQAPHCPAGTSALRLEGTVDGVTVDDSRSTNLNVGLTNFGASTFDSPFSNAFPLQPSELEIHLKWANSVVHGQTGPTTGGSLVAPAGATQAGRTLCITEGAIGFVDGGSEDGVFKFKVSGARAGADCTGEAVTVALRGCFEGGN
jgi:hypothetical protein